jgi:hypothetical protein
LILEPLVKPFFSDTRTNSHSRTQSLSEKEEGRDLGPHRDDGRGRPETLGFRRFGEYVRLFQQQAGRGPGERSATVSSA